MNPEIKQRWLDIQQGIVPEGYKQLKTRIIPTEWLSTSMQNLLSTVAKPLKPELNKLYHEIGIRSHAKGIFYKEGKTGKELKKKAVFWIKPDCFIVNIVFAWEQAVAITTESENGMIASHRFPMYKPNSKLLNLDYLLLLFKTKYGKHLLGLASPGGAGRNKTLGKSRFAELVISIPRLNSQNKIAKIISTWDKAIELKQQLIEQKKSQKKYLMQQLLTGKKRVLNPETGKEFDGEWKEMKLEKLLSYERPDKYIVNFFSKTNDLALPVLTANKAFVLGSTDDLRHLFDKFPIILFDDFTANTKYVDFRFSVRSSAIKILKLKNCEDNLKLIFEMMQMLRFPLGDHKRYYITEYQHLKLCFPSPNEQSAISNILSKADEEIELLKEQLKQIKEQKKGLMQLLLMGVVRV